MDLQSPWMLIVANELTILMIKKTYLEKKEYKKDIVKSHQQMTINSSAKYKDIFDMKQNLSQGKQF